MNLKYNVSKGILSIYLYGELDEHSAKNMRDTIDSLTDENGIYKVIFEMSNLSFMDSTGIGMLIGRYKKLKKKGVPIYIQSPSSSVEKVLQISGLYDIMPKIV